MKKEKTNFSFEHNLYLALKSHGFLFPNDAKEIVNLEKDMNVQSYELPLEFENGNSFVQKRTKVIRLNSEEPMGKKSVKYAKVAAKRARKKKK